MSEIVERAAALTKAQREIMRSFTPQTYFANEGVRESIRWLAAHNVSRAQDYVNGHLDVAVHLRVRGEMQAQLCT